MNQQNPYNDLSRLYGGAQHGCRCYIHRVVHVLDLMAKFMCKLEAHMADFTALNAKVTDLGVSVDAVAAKVDELKAIIAAGFPDQQADVDAVVAALDGIKAKVDALVA